jgi:hypothetical protein
MSELNNLKDLFYYRSCSRLVDLKENDYKVSPFYESESEAEPDSVLHKMYLHFATEVSVLKSFFST